MSLGRSSDGRLFTRDGRLCVGCCGPGLPCEPINRCVSYEDDLGCIIDFGEAFERWRVGIEVQELFYEVDHILRSPNNGSNFPTIENVQETRIDMVDAPAWAGVVSSLGTDELVLCGQVAPEASLRGRFQRIDLGSQDAIEDGVVRNYQYNGGWETISSFVVDGEALRLTASPSTGQSIDDLFLRAIYRQVVFSTFKRFLTPLSKRATTSTPATSSGGLNVPNTYIAFLMDAAARNLFSGSVCQRQGSRTLTGFNLSNGTWFPQFSVSGPVFEHGSLSRPINDCLIVPVNESPTLPDPPPSEFNESYSLSANQTATGFDFEYTHSIRSRRFDTRQVARFDSRYYLEAELDETRTVRVSYTMEPVGDCPPPGVSGFFA